MTRNERGAASDWAGRKPWWLVLIFGKKFVEFGNLRFKAGNILLPYVNAIGDCTRFIMLQQFKLARKHDAPLVPTSN